MRVSSGTGPAGHADATRNLSAAPVQRTTRDAPVPSATVAHSPSSSPLVGPVSFPLTMLLCAVAVRHVAPRWAAVVIGLSALAFPVANIGNIPALGAAVGVATVVGFGALTMRPVRSPSPATPAASAAG